MRATLGRRASARGERLAPVGTQAGRGDVEACFGKPELHRCYGSRDSSEPQCQRGESLRRFTAAEGKKPPTVSAGPLRRTCRLARPTRPSGRASRAELRGASGLRAAATGRRRARCDDRPRAGVADGPGPARPMEAGLSGPRRRRPGSALLEREQPVLAGGTRGSHVTSIQSRVHPRMDATLPPPSGGGGAAGSREPSGPRYGPDSVRLRAGWGAGTQQGWSADGARRRRRSSSEASTPVRRQVRRSARPEVGIARDRVSPRTER